MSNRVDTSAYQGWFKDFYGKAGVSLVNAKCPLTSILMKNKDAEWSGDYFKHAHRFGSGLGLGYRNEGENLPVPSPARRGQSLFRSKSVYGVAEYTGQVIAQSRDNKGAFAKATVDEAEATVEGFQLHMLERAFFGDGTGILGQIDSSPGVSGAGTVGSPWSFTLVIGGSYTNGKRKWFPKNAKMDLYTTADVYGMTIKIVSSSYAAATGVITITAVTESTGAVATPVASDLIYWTGNKGKECTGLRSIAPLSAGTLYGIDQNANPEFSGLLYPVTGTLTYDAINGAVSNQEEESESPDLAIASNITITALKNQSEENKRIPMSEVKSSDLTLGFKGLEIMSEEGPFPMVGSQMCPNGEIWLIKKKHLEIVMRQADFGWMDVDGKVLDRVQGKDMYNAMYGGYFELFCEVPNSISRIYGFSL